MARLSQDIERAGTWMRSGRAASLVAGDGPPSQDIERAGTWMRSGCAASLVGGDGPPSQDIERAGTWMRSGRAASLVAGDGPPGSLNAVGIGARMRCGCAVSLVGGDGPRDRQDVEHAGTWMRGTSRAFFTAHRAWCLRRTVLSCFVMHNIRKFMEIIAQHPAAALRRRASLPGLWQESVRRDPPGVVIHPPIYYAEITTQKSEEPASVSPRALVSRNDAQTALTLRPAPLISTLPRRTRRGPKGKPLTTREGISDGIGL